MKVLENVPIAELTTMRLGGEAKYVLEVASLEEIQEAFDFAKNQNLPVWVMGGGANTIGHDEGFPGVIILNRLRGIFIHGDEGLIDVKEFGGSEPAQDEATFTAMAGESWDNLVEVACAWGYSGIEAMSMIPGTVGAAPVQNIGAYGQDISKVIEQVEAYDTQTGELVKLPKSEMQMGYRHTRFNYGSDAGRFVILSVTIRLYKGSLQPPFYNSLQRYIDNMHETNFSPENIRRMTCEIRSEKLPDPAKIASAGSFFKNVYVDKTAADEAETKGIPVWRSSDGKGKINSGWLIEACGLKGAELYGFKVSDKAALVLINESATSYAQLKKARSQIIDAVKNKFGYTLEQEPVEIPSGEKMI